ncbi:MAG: carboxy-S-adenosyl-L-methionine synthase CmoA [Pseudomonadota bacterium]|jgi:tRNA (cmo5U34)-methyltransferase|uniref:Carboxy-S-adenosyl-L-methionine synthase n=1 Tax=Thiothrix fructosivorans TaxID=111770 RepID=A0A8B0SI37_9GAMM|nr:carboxy-S-adenosyl-L-methionine synthase CmoA [Thiothrix fructosivorans]MBO0611657.1 carboxy-S-adenosyl-L-methionine synthase CmoA [Thiothrix fructosivorans]QTX10684.1 carboxy-S-adenosyl-L-methionine synthase CmoA [Thiothrix fructosivorans]
MQRDAIYALPQEQVVDFAFNEAVADVFPDMIRRSVPGYETIIGLLGVIARRYAQPHSRIYDLGCSLGASTLSMAAQMRADDVRFVCVDNSTAMTRRCEQILQRHLPAGQFEVQCADIEAIPLENASVVVLNFTLQFLKPADRLAMLHKIHAGLLPGGVLILSEKLQFADAAEQTLINDLHLEFKRANGYSELEISQKRSALENVMIPDTFEQHQARLQVAGFAQVVNWFQGFNFASLLAVKA